MELGCIARNDHELVLWLLGEYVFQTELFELLISLLVRWIMNNSKLVLFFTNNGIELITSHLSCQHKKLKVILFIEKVWWYVLQLSFASNSPSLPYFFFYISKKLKN